MQEIVCTANEAGIFHGVDGPDEKWYPQKDYHTMYLGRNRKSSCKGVKSGDEKKFFYRLSVQEYFC